MGGAERVASILARRTDVAHAADEYVEVEQLETASAVLWELVRTTVGLGRSSQRGH